MCPIIGITKPRRISPERPRTRRGWLAARRAAAFYRITSPLDALRAQGWDTGYAFGDPPPDLAKIIVY